MMLMMRIHVNPFLLKRFLVIRLRVLFRIPNVFTVMDRMQLCRWLEWRRWRKYKINLLFRLNTYGFGARWRWFSFQIHWGSQHGLRIWSFIYRLWKFSKYPLRESSQGVEVFRLLWVWRKVAGDLFDQLKMGAEEERTQEVVCCREGAETEG